MRAYRLKISVGRESVRRRIRDNAPVRAYFLDGSILCRGPDIAELVFAHRSHDFSGKCPPETAWVPCKWDYTAEIRTAESIKECSYPYAVFVVFEEASEVVNRPSAGYFERKPVRLLAVSDGI